jgi:homospermidine synthase
MAPAKGDIVIELATRICTHTIWKECKSRGVHFMNSGFDVWPDITLDLDLMTLMAKDPIFAKGSGPTCVFSFGCNPGIASHFVRHGLFAATGIADTREAAKAFGLKSISFNERDTQWPLPGSKGEAHFLSTQLDVLYNTWSPGNYIVETGESTILYAGCPEEAKEISSAGPAVVAWTPTGPNIGFMAPHDETFTIQVRQACADARGTTFVFFSLRLSPFPPAPRRRSGLTSPSRPFSCTRRRRRRARTSRAAARSTRRSRLASC